MSNFKSKFLLGVMTVAIMFVGVVAVKATPAAADCTITATLRVGSKGAEVACLQTVVGATADGNFGKMTKASVMAWQSGKGLVADGVFGPKSRAIFNAGGSVPGTFAPAGCTSASGFSPVTGGACYAATSTVFPAGCTSASGFSPLTGASCATGVVVTNPTGPLSVSLALDNPAGGNVLSGQALADLAHFTFTGTGTLSQVTLQRTGLSVSADVSNVYLFDGNQRLTDGASVNTAGNIVFNNVNIAVSGSRTISVKVDMAATTTSVNLGVTLTGYMVTGSTTANAVSVAGNLFYVSTAPTGGTSATLNATTVSSGNVNAGSMNYTVWANGLQVNGRAGLLKGLNLHFIGSAPTDSLANAKLFLDGTAIGTPSTVNAAGYLFFDLGAGVNLGVSTHTLEVHADIIKGSNRNFQLSLQNSSDLMITDSQIGININAATAVTNGVAGTITVNPGSVTVNVDPAFNTVTRVTGGATNVTVAKYKFTAYGEDMKITSLTVTPTVASPTYASALGTGIAGSLNNVALYANGGQIGSSQGFVGTALVYPLGSSLIVPAGTTTIVEVRLDTITNNNINYTGTTLTTLLAGSTSNAQGMSSQNLTTSPSTSGVASGALTIGAATATVAVSTGLNSKNVISNTAKTKIGSFVVQAGSTEGVRMTNLQVGLVFGAAVTTYASGTINATGAQTITFAGGGTVNLAVGDIITIEAGATDAVGSVTSITNGTVAVVTLTVAGTTTGTPSAVTGQSGPMALTNVSNLYTSDDTATVIGNPTATNNFSVNYTLAPSTSKTIDVYADLGGLNAGTVQSTLKITAVGGTTNVALTTGTGIASALNGQVMTVAAGTVATPTLTTSSMVSQFVVGGASPSLVTYNFVATNGDATITELIFGVTTTTTAIDHVCVGAVCAPVIGGVATVAGLNIVVPAGYAGKDIIVTPTYSLVGIGQQTSNSLVGLDITSVKYTIGNTTTTTVATITGRNMRLVGSHPTVTINTSTRSGLSNTLVKLADVTVTANAAGAIKLKQLPIITTSTGLATIATGTNNVTVKDGSGNVLNTTYTITNATFVVAANGSSADVPLVFGTPYNIPAGTSVTFGIYATAATVSGAVNTTSLSTKLGAAAGFLFDDVNGNVANIPANDGTNTNILNYPVDGSVITN